MKPITKIIIFVVIAFIIIIGITMAAKSVVAPGTLEEAPQATITPVATVPAAASPSTPASTGNTYTIAQVAKHKTATDCWTIVGGNVFNVTPFVSQHPGGVEAISKTCGVDATVMFTAQHGSNENAQKALASLKIGVLGASL